MQTRWWSVGLVAALALGCSARGGGGSSGGDGGVVDTGSLLDTGGGGEDRVTPPEDNGPPPEDRGSGPTCGNGTCNEGESCTSCPGDCGPCEPRCGDAMCNGTETCSTCAQDCGACPARCGDGTCNEGETCTNCAQDCGACPATCGDGSCNGTETCTSCAQDCGACPARCGDSMCNGSESCQTCAQDCGSCEPRCGDSLCNGSENCTSCRSDCGACPAQCGNGTCDASENCQVCSADCGTCSQRCGDGMCTGTETCGTCPTDCGSCTNTCAVTTSCGACATNTACGWCSDAMRCVAANSAGGPSSGCTAANFVRSATLCSASTTPNYTRTFPTNTFLDACSQTNARTAILASQDDAVSATTLPFAFNLFGRPFAASSAVTLSTNGWMALGTAASAIEPNMIPNAIAPQGRDLITTTGGLCTAVVGTPGARRYLIQWNAARTYASGGGTGTFTFQIVLNEGTNVVDFFYQTMSPATSAFIGLVNSTGSGSYSGCTTNPCAVMTGNAIRFTPSP